VPKTLKNNQAIQEHGGMHHFEILMPHAERMEKESTENAVAIGAGKAGPGRPKGKPNRTTQVLREAIFKAAETAGGGGKNGLVNFLLAQARKENNAPFMALVAKVLPSKVLADAESDAAAMPVIFINRYACPDGSVSAGPPEVPLLPGDWKRHE
jgi:hypothetical protein